MKGRGEWVKGAKGLLSMVMASRKMGLDIRLGTKRHSASSGETDLKGNVFPLEVVHGCSNKCYVRGTNISHVPSISPATTT